METRVRHISEMLSCAISRTTSLLTVVLILILLLTTACSQDSIEDYQEALEKTENIQRGKSQTKLELSMVFETEGLDEEAIRQLKSFENILFEGTTRFDSTGDDVKVSSLNLISLGGLGLNFDYHQDGENTALYIPMLGKYLNLTAEEMKALAEENGDFAAYQNMRLTQETLDALEKLWRETFEADEVVKGEKSTMETPEGDVRVVKFTVTPERDKLKTFVRDAVEIVADDENIKESIEERIGDASEDGEVILMKDFLSGLNDTMKLWDVTEFYVIDYVDIDGYIVESNVNVVIRIATGESGAMKSFDMQLVTKNYDIEKPQDIVFPELTEENSLTIDELEKGLPSTYENLLN